MNNNMNENTKDTNATDIKKNHIARIIQSLCNSICDTPANDDMKETDHSPLNSSMSYLDGIIARIDKEWREITNDNILLELRTVSCSNGIDCIHFDNIFYIY